MIVPDANLLIYAYDEHSPRFEAARGWLEGCLSGNEPVGFTCPVLFAFIRVATLRAAFNNPMTLEKASAVVRAWLARRVARVLTPGSDHVERVLTLLHAAGSAGGNLVTDAQIAAIAMAYRATVHTADHDFQRFPGLNCRFPLSEPSRK